MENENANDNASNVENNDAVVVATETSGLDVAALQAKLTETETKNKQLFERAKKAEGFELKDGHWVKAPKEAPAVQQRETKTGEAEDTTQLLLEVKGITEDDEQAIFQKWTTDTGRKPREILGNKIFQAELAAHRAEKATQAAIPSSNGRSAGGSSQNIDALAAKFEQTGELPKDFATKAKVLETVTAKSDLRTPPWHR